MLLKHTIVTTATFILCNEVYLPQVQGTIYSDRQMRTKQKEKINNKLIIRLCMKDAKKKSNFAI